MPYTRPYNIANIPGSTLASKIDEEFRAHKLDLLERFNDALFVDFTADPLVLKDTLKGNVTGKVIVIPHNNFRERIGGPKRPEINELYTAIFEDTGTMQASVILPPGVTVTKVEFLVNRGSIDTINWTFDGVDFDTSPIKVPLAAGGYTTAGVGIISSGAIAAVISANAYYQVTLETISGNNTDSFLLYGARITYDAPAHTNTL